MAPVKADWVRCSVYCRDMGRLRSGDEAKPSTAISGHNDRRHRSTRHHESHVKFPFSNKPAQK